MAGPCASVVEVDPGAAVFAWIISHQPAVLFSHNKPDTSNQSAVLFFKNKSATSQQYSSVRTNQSPAICWEMRRRVMSAREGSERRWRLG
jgi:hypothetical protein